MKLLDKFPGPWAVHGDTGNVYAENGEFIMTLSSEWTLPENADDAGRLARAVSLLPRLLGQLKDDLESWPEYEADEEVDGCDMVEYMGQRHSESLSLLGHIEPEAADEYRKWARRINAERYGHEDDDEEDA